MATKVQITVELLEKLAGIRSKPSSKQQQQRQKQQQQQQQQHLLSQPVRLGLGGLPLPPHLQADSAAINLKQHQHHNVEQELQQVIRESKRVGELLLKAGDQELAAVQQQAGQLLSSFRSQLKPTPCGPEQQAVLQCYKEHAQDVLACSGLIDAYYACAQQSVASSEKS